jgi:hypothetical protein
MNGEEKIRAADANAEDYEGEAGAKTGPAQESVDPAWSNPISLETPILPEIPQGIMPEWADDHIEAVAAATETPRELSAMMTLGTVSAATQNKFAVEVHPGYVEPVNVWCLPTGPSGERKTAVLMATTEPVRDWELAEFKRLKPDIAAAASKRKSLEAQIDSLRRKAAHGSKHASVNFDNEIRRIADLEVALPEIPNAPRVWCQDITPEALGALMADHEETMACLSDEGGIFDILGGRYSNGIPNLDLFLQAHSGAPVRVDRRSRASVMLNHPTLTMVLSPQPSVLQGLAAKPGFRGRGLLARFLYALPVTRLGYREGKSTPVPSAIASEYSRHLRSLLEKKRPVDGLCLIKLSSEAWREWHQFFLAVEHDLREGERFEHIRDWAGKLPGAAARIAGLIHCAKHALANPENQEIDVATMKSALELAAVLTHHALAAFDIMGADLIVKNARRVWAWIKREQKPSFTFRDCFRALQRTFSRAVDLEPAIAALVERSYIAQRPKEPGATGRPSRVFDVNPAITEHWKEK